MTAAVPPRDYVPPVDMRKARQHGVSPLRGSATAIDGRKARQHGVSPLRGCAPPVNMTAPSWGVIEETQRRLRRRCVSSLS
ncbi:hypothetical protein AGMMS49525_07760 [Bacteroidia bacterium]|nr:hypothetical protein AGMMS49525_07760 [Bacteroidia bacterium]